MAAPALWGESVDERKGEFGRVLPFHF